MRSPQASRHQHVLRFMLDSVACAFALSPSPREGGFTPCLFSVGQMETQRAGHPSPSHPAFSGQVDQAVAPGSSRR